MSPSLKFLSQISVLLAFTLGALSLGGCTSSGGMAEQLQAAAQEEAALPDTVDAVPAARGEDFALASYAGPTPASADTVFAPAGRFGPDRVAARSPELDLLIARYAEHYDVPEGLVRRVVKRESTFDPAARNGPYWGLMQILPQTARTMGHSGPPEELLDAETNLKYAVRYLRGAYLTAGGDEDQAVRLYARGYYYDAKAAGLLDETGLGRDRRRVN
ncbi:MAG: lytic transglycosylase domain-containing protein [Rhizobiaceae bacterium]|nr:lytic transglycosylase domain-containing protein [Rhizobiaceae bacterium]